MAEHFRDEFDKFVVPPLGGNSEDCLKAELQTYAAEAELLRGVNSLPTLSHRLRTRVLNAASSAYRQARRWAQARQAASFLSICLLASFVLSPLANLSSNGFVWVRQLRDTTRSMNLASRDTLSFPQQPDSAWSLRHNRVFLDLPRAANSQLSALSSQPSKHLVARTEASPPSDNLLTALNTSDGWATVQAFQAVRSRSQSTLQRAFAAN